MMLHHYHFGKDGGREKFFVHLVRALGERGVQQAAFIRPGRIWREDIEPYAKIVESHFRNLSPDRLLLPLRASWMARHDKADALMAWGMRPARLIPAYKGAIKLARLGDYPSHLGYYKTADVLVCNTPDIADRVRKLGWTRGVEVISNFTDASPVEPISRAAVDTPEGVPVIMGLGRLEDHKRFNILLQAAASIPDAFVWIVGDGTQMHALRELATSCGMRDRVRFLGWQKDPRPHMAAADIFVMPSRHEPLGNVILEAWAQKRPVVSSRSEGPNWFMRDGENGLLVDIDDTAGFSRAISQLLNDTALAAAVAEGGHKTLMSQFSEDAVAGAYLELFKRSRNPRSRAHPMLR